MAKKNKFIADPNAQIPRQEAFLFGNQSEPRYDPFPELYTRERATHAAFNEILEETVREGMAGVDLEFDPRRSSKRITVLGISSMGRAISLPWDRELGKKLLDVARQTGMTLTGHSTVGAEKYEFDKEFDICTPTSLWDCSMIGSHLCNADWTKLASKEEGEESGTLGLLGLWTTASYYTNLPMWKDHRDRWCSGPCPRCDVWGYNAVDAWASLASFRKQQEEMRRFNIPQEFYRDRVDLTDMCVRMEHAGLNVDRDWVAQMEKKSKEFKDSLFPYETINGKTVYTEVNPKSPKQLLEYCKEKNIALEGTTKADVAKILEKTAKKEGFAAENVKALCAQLETATELSKNLDMLYRLYQFKSSGKGVKSWFDEKYYGKDGKLHPRFVTTGACTGRLSSSRPNFQNIPARGWGKELKKAIVPNEGMDFLLSDFSQLELRVILYLAGFDASKIGKDAFSWLAANSNGQFAKAAAALSMSERDVAKSISHGSNYCEGLQILMPQDLARPNIQAEIAYGARAVYMKKYMPRLEKDWDYRGGIVSFTGANLAERLFGDRSLANRKKALEIVEGTYFSAFFAIREWQMKVLEMAERGYVQSPVGRYLRLYGSPEDDAKMAVAFFGQGLGADFVQAVMLRFDRERNVIPVLNVHDMLMFEVPKEMPDDKAREFISLMQEPTELLAGLAVPGKAERGPNYGETKPL